jgi:hypothetical protein
LTTVGGSPDVRVPLPPPGLATLNDDPDRDEE